jgi:hypothetical protein
MAVSAIVPRQVLYIEPTIHPAASLPRSMRPQRPTCREVQP